MGTGLANMRPRGSALLLKVGESGFQICSAELESSFYHAISRAP